MERSISFWGYKEQESNLILPEHDDDDNKLYWLRVHTPELGLLRDEVNIFVIGSIFIEVGGKIKI